MATEITRTPQARIRTLNEARLADGRACFSGVVDVGDGWRLELSNECMVERNPDGSWSAWDAAPTIDVHIITVTATESGNDVEVATMLGREQNTQGSGWIGHVEELSDPDDQGDALRLAITAAAPNTLMSCWVAFRAEAERGWATDVLATIEFVPMGGGNEPSR